MVTSDSGLRRYLPAETLQPLVWLGLFFGFSALPVAIVYATRSSPTILALACLTLVADEYYRNPTFSRLRALAKGSLRKPMVLPLLAITVLGVVSALWSAAPEHSFQTGLQFAGTVLLGLSWVVLVSRFRREHVLPFLAGGLITALLALPVELLLPAGIRDAFAGPIAAHEYNRTILQLSLLVTLFAALASLRGDLLWRIVAAALLIATMAVAVASESQSSVLYWLVFALGGVAAGLAPRVSLLAVGLAVGIVVLAFPWAFLFWDEAIIESAISLLSADFAETANVQDRLLIWTEFAGIVAERPWFGWGMEGERAMDLSVLPGGDLLAYSPHHPHSLALELWTGLGAAGVALAIAVLVGFVRLVARYRDPQVAWATCLFAGSSAIWLISHGAWEHWWLTMLPLSLGTLLALDFYAAGEEPIAPS